MDANGLMGISANMDGAYEVIVMHVGVLGMFLGSTFLAIKIYLEYTRYTLSALGGSNAAVPWDWNEIVRILFLMMILANFKTMADGVRLSIRQINMQTQKDSADYTAVKNTWTDAYQANVATAMGGNINRIDKLLAAVDNDKNMSADQKSAKKTALQLEKFKGVANSTHDYNSHDGIDESGQHSDGEIMEGAMEQASSWNPVVALTNLAMGFLFFLSWAAKALIGEFAGIVFLIGLCFGPLVLAFGILNKSLITNYVGLLLNWGLVFTTINILDGLLFGFAIGHAANPDKSDAIVFFIIMIGCYFSAFKITKWFIGFSGMNALMNSGMAKVAGGIAAVAAVAIGGAMLAGGASGGAASKTAGGVSQAGKKAGESGRVD